MKLQEHPQALRSALCYIPTGTHGSFLVKALGKHEHSKEQESSAAAASQTPLSARLCGASSVLFLEEEQRGGGRTGSTALVPVHAELQPLSFQMKSFSDLLAFHFFPWKLTPCPALGPTPRQPFPTCPQPVIQVLGNSFLEVLG